MKRYEGNDKLFLRAVSMAESARDSRSQNTPIEATKRQWSRWNQQRGSAYAMKEAARRAIIAESLPITAQVTP